MVQIIVSEQSIYQKQYIKPIASDNQITISEDAALFLFENENRYEAPQVSTKLLNFAVSAANDENAPFKININPFSDVSVQSWVQSIIDNGLTALSLPTGQTKFTIKELIALAGATFTDSNQITLHYYDANTIDYIVFTDGEVTKTMGTTENVS